MALIILLFKLCLGNEENLRIFGGTKIKNYSKARAIKWSIKKNHTFVAVAPFVVAIYEMFEKDVRGLDCDKPLEDKYVLSAFD